MPGFDAEFKDLPHYIYCITERIWESRQVGTIRRYYHEQCPVRSTGGLVIGSEDVVRATLATLAEFPDRRLLGEDVIWKGNDREGYLSSHRILSTATHSGNGAYGAATGRRLQYRVIADCWVKNNQVCEEWLVRDQGAIAQGLGMTPCQLAKQQISAGQKGFFMPSMDVPSAYALPMSTDEDAQAYLSLYQEMWRNADLSVIGRRYHEAATLYGANGVSYAGHSDIDKFHLSYLAAFRDLQFTAHDLTATENENGKTVALRWSVSGKHSGVGAFSAPSQGAPLHLMAISQARMGKGRITAEWLIVDEVAMWKQILVHGENNEL